MVNIYLNSDYQSPFLTIPNSDVERLSNRPFRWLRYVMFSICGARGDLFHTSDASDDPVDYDTSLDDLPDAVYYKTSGDCIFVDYQGLNDRITSTDQTRCREKFRRVVKRRDGCCVVEGTKANACDAVHLIPRSKGDEYIAKVVKDRSPLYDQPPSISGINDGQNGLLLGKNLHSHLGAGDLAFIKTPNYRLDPGDIKRVHLGPACTDHITLQQLKKPMGYNPARLASLMEEAEWGFGVVVAALVYGAHLDVQFRGRPTTLPQPTTPPALILDYAYGVAAYNCWRSREGNDKVHAAMEEYRRANYEHILPIPRRHSDDSDDSSTFERQYNAHGPDHPPHKSRRRRPHMSLRRGDYMAKAMDEMNLALMAIQGITPREAAIRREKRMEEEEQKAQEASRSKVMEWMRGQ